MCCSTMGVKKNLPLYKRERKSDTYNTFAEMRRGYLREHKDGIYTGMLLEGTLERHLREIGESAQAMFDRIAEQMKKAESVTEQLKATDQMERIGRMNNIRQQAEEIVLHDLIYN